ncbi:MAG: ABC transporter substrate-binding protein [Desulfobacterales bacterium]|jgi:ABC-type transport system substrate-binding protein
MKRIVLSWMVGAAAVIAVLALVVPVSGAEPVRGGTLIYGSVTEVASLDPHVYQGTAWKAINLCLYNSLLGFNRSGEPSPSLAESWETPDAKTVIFKLRKGVTFHQGQPFTAKDVKYSLERIVDPATGATLRANLKDIRVTIIDDYTVKIEKDEPDVTMLSVLAMGETSIVSEAWMKTNPNVKVSANGTGPFKLAKNEPKVRVIVERNPTYFESDLPYLDSIDFRMIKDGEARVNALKTGAVHMIDTVPWKDIDILKAMPGISVDVADGEFMNLWLNTSKEPLNDPRVRRAISYAIDREAISEAAFFGYGTPLYGPPTIAGTFYYNDDLSNTFSHDPEKAKALLAEAGVGGGFELELLTYHGLPIYTVTAQIVQSNLKEVGIEVNIQLSEWAALVEKKNKGDYDFLIYGVTIKSPDPDAYSYYFGAESTYWAQPVGFSDPTVEALLSEGRTTIDPKGRKAIYHQLEKRVLELTPWVFVNWRAKAQAYNDRVHGYVHLGGALSESFPGVKTVWIAP